MATATALFRKRSTNYTPLLVYRAEEMMNESATIAQFQSDASQVVPAVPDSATPFAAGASQTSAFAATLMTVRGETCLLLASNFFEQLCMTRDDHLPAAISLHNTAEIEGLRYEDYKSFGPGLISQKRKYLDGGAVVAEMDVVIGADGRAHNIHVIQALGHGLDEEAIRAMRDSWRFKPALGPDGKPAPVRMLIDVEFHLF